MQRAVDKSLPRKSILEAAATLGIVAALGGRPTPAAAANGVVGAWSLSTFVIDEGKDSEKPRFGANPVGYLLYTESGRMSAVLGGTHRALLEPPPSTASEHCAASVGDFLAYAGRYEIKGDRVFHHVEVCVFTNLIGTTLERRFTLDGDKLTIRTLPPEIWGTSNVLVWKRAQA